MPIHNFLRRDCRAPLRDADLVVQVSEINGRGDRVVRRGPTGIALGHSGLAREKTDHGLGEDVVVYHLVDFIEKERWGCGTGSHESPLGVDDTAPPTVLCVDVAGTVPIEQPQRDIIVDIALKFWSRRPSRLARRNSCYWLGDPNPSAHPNRPGGEDAYSFSCSTFVHYCYVSAGIPIVDIDSLPFITDEERLQFAAMGLPMQQGPFRRLTSANLISAFEAPNHPVSMGTWRTDEQVFEELLTVPSAATEESEPLALHAIA